MADGSWCATPEPPDLRQDRTGQDRTYWRNGDGMIVSEKISGSIIWLRSTLPVAGDGGDVQCAVYTSYLLGTSLKEAIARTLALHATRTSTRTTKRCHLHIPTAVRRHCISASASDIYPIPSSQQWLGRPHPAAALQTASICMYSVHQPIVLFTCKSNPATSSHYYPLQSDPQDHVLDRRQN